MKVQVAENVYWVGAVDWNVRNFHGYTYTTPRGTTYNAYLVLGEKIALVDTVAAPFADEMLERIREFVDPARIDYLIANHGEIDHSGAIPRVLALAPQAKLICTAKGTESLGRYFGPLDRDFTVVKSGDRIDLGGLSLTFLEAPMLHWPDSMFTYIPERALLLPNDAFGQHLASAERFADQVDPWVLWDEAARYYANILLPFSPLVVKKIEEVQKMGLAIETIAPSHGVIWRKDPMQIVNAYLRWAQGETVARALVVYETMWGSTEQLARAIAEGIAEEGVGVALRGLPMADRTDVVKELLEARGLVVGSSTHNGDMLLNMAAFLADLRGLKPKGKLGAAFGSYGWAPRVVGEMEAQLREAGFEVVEANLAVKFAPSAEDLTWAWEFGREFARRIKSH
ncbi:MAG: flavodoxin domain-containing protein [Chloroflexi bacterium]|nr:flavodoxin domain-containing protein [Chloroflexota bacterium]